MKSRFYSITFLIVIIVTLNSCQLLLREKFGIKKPKKETFEDQKTFLIKNNLDTNNLYFFNPIYLDSIKTHSYYLTYTDSSAGLSPVQFRMYNKKGNFVAGWAQCFGDPKQIALYEQFPPKTNDWVNTHLNLFSDYKLLVDKDGKMINPYEFVNGYDYIIIAFWAEYMGKLSRNMLVDLERYLEDNKDKKVVLLKANWGNPFSNR